MASERPRRSTRIPTKYQDKPAVEITQPGTSLSTTKKRKAPLASHDDPTSLDFLLTNPKSPLVSLELPTLINEHTWSALSQDSRALLSTMLPQTVFPFFQPRIDPCHPAERQRVRGEVEANPMDIDSIALASEPNMSFFTDPFFEADARTFQVDHLYSGWFTPTHEALVQEYTQKLKKGEVHVPWKDDTWAREHPVSELRDTGSVALAGEASSLTLRDLAKHSILRVGDLLAYRRPFSQFNITVAKDVLIDSIHSTTHSLTILAAPSAQTYLPRGHLTHPDLGLDRTEGPLQAMTITNPSQLESALLDMDARIDKGKRPNGNAWKCIGVWRWGDGESHEYAEESEEAKRGGRVYHGTLFYLRGCFYDDQ